MTYLKVNTEEMQALSKLPEGQEMVMLNLLKYRESVSETGQSGAAGYTEYLRAAAPFFAKVDAEIVFFGRPQSMLIGPLEDNLWDAVLLVRYGSPADFLNMVQAEGYPAHLRQRALKDSRLIYCKPSVS